MKRISCFAVFYFTLLAYISTPSAIEHPTVLLEEGNGITQQLRAIGCSEYWLSDVMAASGISAVDLLRLPVGKVLVLPTDCHAAPPQDVVAKSRSVMQTDRARVARVSAPILQENERAHHEAIEALEADIAGLLKKQQSANAKISELTKKNTELEARNAELLSEKSNWAASIAAEDDQTYRISHVNFWVAGIAFTGLIILLTFVITFAVMRLYNRYWRHQVGKLTEDNLKLQNSVRWPVPHVIRLGRGNVEFPFASYDVESEKILYACCLNKSGLCHVRNLELGKDGKNLVRHAQRNHPEIFNPEYDLGQLDVIRFEADNEEATLRAV